MKIVRASQGLRPKGPLLKSSPVVGSRPSTDGIWGGITHFCGSPRHRHHQNHQVRIRTFVAPRVIIKQQRWTPPPGREHRLPRPLCGSPCRHHQTTHPCASGVAKGAKNKCSGVDAGHPSHPHHFPPRILKRSPWCPILIIFDTECVFVHQNLRMCTEIKFP